MTLSTTALAQYDTPKLIAIIHELESEVAQLRQQLKWRDQLDAVPATVMSQNQKAAGDGRISTDRILASLQTGWHEQADLS